MRKNNSTRTPHARQQREPDFDEPFRRWSTVPVSRERACELVDLITRREDRAGLEALIELICALTPDTSSDDKYVLDERFLAGHAALMHAFTDTARAVNALGAYVVELKCGEWK